jgi:glutaredoxin 1
MKIEIFGTPTCQFCSSAKALCKTNGFEMTYTDILPIEARKALEDRIGQPVKTVPQIIVNDKYVGGFNDFKNFLKG